MRIKHYLLCLFCCLQLFSNAQGRDKFGILVDLSFGIVPMKMEGTSEVTNSGIMVINNNEIAVNPIYEYKTIRSAMFNTTSHIAVNFPFYKTENWSLGVKLGVGIGFQQGFKSLEDFTSIVFDFPQYAYFKHNGERMEYSVLLGYKYSYASLPYQLVIAGFEYHFNLENSFRFYTSFIGNRYYTLYSNGDLKPAVKTNEFGFVLIHQFSKK